MNKYVAIYNGKQITVEAETLYKAKQLAVSKFNPPKSKQHMVSIMLCEANGQAVVHTAVD